MAQADSITKIKPNLKLKTPSRFGVVYMNDDKTSMEFVIESLIKHFKYEGDKAYETTLKVHEDGSAVVAILPYEIAEIRSTEVVRDARSQGFPLQVKLQETE
jgi:ATP-dependent Clp protease adaptor protein ClpS